jgi:hypothetical protein
MYLDLFETQTCKSARQKVQVNSQNAVVARGAPLACVFRGGTSAGRFLPVAEHALGHASILCVLDRLWPICRTDRSVRCLQNHSQAVLS